MPAKSGVSGLVMVIVPNRCGFATFSPRLDDAGNSVRGVAFFKALVEQFTVHVLDNYSAGINGFKFDLGVPVRTQLSDPSETLGWAASLGEPSARGFQRIFLKLVDIDGNDFKPGISKLCAQRVELRQGFSTWAAP